MGKLEVYPYSPLGKALVVGILVIFISCAGYLWLKWDVIPQQFPDHWDQFGHPNGWGTRSFADVYEGMMIALVIDILLLMAARYSKSDKPPAQIILLATAFVVTIVSGGLAVYAPLHASGQPTIGFFVGTSIACLILMVMAFVYFFRSADDEGWETVDNDPSSNWKMGIFYYDPDDSAVFVERRLGFGWTLNFGNVASWLILAIILIFAFFPAY